MLFPFLFLSLSLSLPPRLFHFVCVGCAICLAQTGKVNRKLFYFCFLNRKHGVALGGYFFGPVVQFGGHQKVREIQRKCPADACAFYPRLYFSYLFCWLRFVSLSCLLGYLSPFFCAIPFLQLGNTGSGHSVNELEYK